MKVNILGTEYEIIKKNKAICCGNLKTFPDWCNETIEYCEKQGKITVRHEIIPAFLYEGGLSVNSSDVKARGTNQFPKLLKAFERKIAYNKGAKIWL